MRSGTAHPGKERGLSEVIGFVLILGIITAAFSLYLVYGVPAQGRENEINHMNEVKDQFVTYKIGLDALWVNHQVGTTVSNSFTLGTGGGYTQGSNSIIPILSPVSSGGIIGINERGTENLTITAQSLIVNSTNKSTTSVTVGQNVTLASVPQHLHLNISGISSSDLASAAVFGAQLQGTDSAGTSWTALVNITPRTTQYNETKSVVCPTTTSCTITYNSGYRYTSSDLTLTVSKAGTTTLQNYIVSQNIATGNYTVDLMDAAYGLDTYIGSSTYPITLALTKSQSPLQDITPTAFAVYGYTPMTYSWTIPMGSLEYDARNYYWIPQTYYYQMGGLFLYQSTDNGTTTKLPPEIAFYYTNGSTAITKIVTVNINALQIDPSNAGLVGGNSPVQIKTTLTNQTTLPFVSGLSANTQWITIAVTTADPSATTAWQTFFNTTALTAGIPNYQVGTFGNSTYIRIDGANTTSGVYDINVNAQNALYAVRVYGIGGSVQ